MQRPLEMLEKSANPQTVYGFTGEHKQTHNTSQTMPSPQVRKRGTHLLLHTNVFMQNLTNIDRWMSKGQLNMFVTI